MFVCYELLAITFCYPCMEDVLKQVRDFADKAHGDQMRKYSPERCIVHPVRVMNLCREYADSLPVLAAALLHDVLEDTSVTEKDILSFLETIMDAHKATETVSLVIELTDVYVKKNYPKMNGRTRKQKEAERMIATSADAQTIKYADIIDNSKEIAENDPDFAKLFLAECRNLLKKMDRGDEKLRERAVEAVNTAYDRLK